MNPGEGNGAEHWGECMVMNPGGVHGDEPWCECMVMNPGVSAW